MACEFCTNLAAIEGLKRYVGYEYETRYCPVCGENLVIVNLIKSLEMQTKEYFRELVLWRAAAKKEIVKIDGKELPVERVPWADKKPEEKLDTPLKMGINLDEVDISKEALWLSSYENDMFISHIGPKAQQEKGDKK